MSENFYTILLDYLSTKERQALCQLLQKKRVCVDGFRMNKDTPSRLLAVQLVKKENTFFSVLRKHYKSPYSEKQEAVDAFSPDTVLLCLSYFFRSCFLVDENAIITLIEKDIAASKAVSTESKTEAANKGEATSANEKAQKKYEELRQKYLLANKKLANARGELKSAEQDNAELQKKLHIREGELSAVREEAGRLQNKYTISCDTLNNRIHELEREIDQLCKPTEEVEENILVLLSEGVDTELDVDTLEYCRIAELSGVMEKYTRILFVVNNLPFVVKRQINKLEGLQEKLLTFSTFNELAKYIENRRGN